MSKDMIDNIQDKSLELNNMYEFIKGDIEDITYEYFSGGDEYIGAHDYIEQNSFAIYIKTSISDYKMIKVWCRMNTKDANETGIRMIMLYVGFDPHNDKLLYTIKGLDPLYKNR